MLAIENRPYSAGSSARPLLPLKSGEFMHSRELLRRYERMPRVKQAGLITGAVYLGSPVSVRQSQPGALIQGLLVAEARLEWFCLEEEDYRPQLPDAQGVLHSRVFPGLRLPVAPLLAGAAANVLAALTDAGLEAAKNR